ncbi:hypothetical protein SAMN04488498_1102 [Mesorhizobium albiziae]|uniref:Uncharacterized protein n=2 Tax=Neomesorhizobium albiziae TaxID=335020 RepID=A0A1I4BC65_9HYPH|nr:hypothetical protein SAMN04488498_1102 [Mesorhizobium albiziae]
MTFGTDSEKMGSLNGKCISAQATQKVPVAQPTEQQVHLTVNVFRIAEHAVLLADTHGAEFTRPCVDIWNR